MKIHSRRHRLLVATVALTAAIAGGCGRPNASDQSAITTTSLQRENTTSTGAASTSTPSPASEASAREVELRDGSVVGGLQHIQASLGERLTIRVRSDVADEVHLHGYDLSKRVAPDAPATFTFTADIPGVFELELEGRGMLLARLEVA